MQKKFFRLGEWRNGVSNLHYARDHLGNLREMTDNANVVRARYEYDPQSKFAGVTTTREWDLAHEMATAALPNARKVSPVSTPAMFASRLSHGPKKTGWWPS